MFAVSDQLRSWLLPMLFVCALTGFSFVRGCMHGEQLAAGKTAQRDQRAQQADIRRIDNAIEAAQGVATASAEQQVRIVTKFQPIEREVIRYVQTPAAAELCLDADGLRIWTAANRGEFEAAASQPAGHAALRSGYPAASQWRSGGCAGEPCADGQALEIVRSEAGSAGQSHQRGEPRPGAAE